MIVIDDFQQQSDEWFAARLGNPGASSFDQIITNATGKPSKSAEGYMMELAGEIISGQSEAGYTNHHMEIGNQREQDARDEFEWETDLTVRQVALCYPDDNKRFHCSPDGLTSDGGGLEIKCPKMKTHIKYLLGGKLPTEYIAQVQGSLLVTGLSHWYFHSHYPSIKPLIVKVLPDAEYIKKMKVMLDDFCDGLNEMVRKLKAMR